VFGSNMCVREGTGGDNLGVYCAEREAEVVEGETWLVAHERVRRERARARL
jgi:hypothetical protein